MQARGGSDRARPPRAEGETFSLGRYLIIGRIASGGMATVFRARLDGEGGFAREFAIKVIHPHLAAAAGFKERFLDEARVASRVNHPNVVATIDSDQDRGYHYLVLGLVEGVTLRQLQVNDLHRSSTSPGTRERSHLSPAEAARVVCDAARGLHAVHSVADDEGQSLDVVHRDLSPHNLMVDETGRTILIDLGLAKARGQLGHTQTGVLCGKLPYMSPEQSRLEPLDARSDVFSLGSVLFELAVGDAPFGDDHTPGTLDNLRTCDGERLGAMLEDARVPTWLSQVILTCLRPDPRDRYGSAEALADALDGAMRRAGIDVSAAREALARRASRVRHKLGPEQPADPLPPLITPDSTGPHLAVSGSRVPPWLRGLGMAAAGAVLVVVGLTTANALQGASAANAEHRWKPSLAVDTAILETRRSAEASSRDDADTDEGSEQAKPQSGPNKVAGLPPSADEAGEDESETEGEPAPKPKRSNARKKDPLDDFKKSNPYD